MELSACLGRLGPLGPMNERPRPHSGGIGATDLETEEFPAAVKQESGFLPLALHKKKVGGGDRSFSGWLGSRHNFYLGLLGPPSVRLDAFTRRTGPASFEWFQP